MEDSNIHNQHNNHNIDNTSNNGLDTPETTIPELLYLADALVVNNASEDTILKYLRYSAVGIGLDLEEKHLLRYVYRARFRIKKQKTNLTAQIRDWISITNGNFSITDLLQTLTFITKQDRPTVTVIINRLIKDGLIERVGKANGIYRRVEKDLNKMDYMNADGKCVDIWFPLGVHKMVKTMPGNIIILAGAPNGGKTAYLLNCVLGNQDKFNVHYFNSEMGEDELKVRLELFWEGHQVPLKNWDFSAWERTSNFEDVIKTGEGNLNIIDYLEIHDNFWEIGGIISKIHQKLDGAIAIIAIQKPPGRDTGRGGFATLEKPRLYMSLEHGKLKIVKAKTFVDHANNPNGQQINFKLACGCKFIAQGNWYKEQNE